MPIGGQKEMHSKGMEMDDEDAAVIRPALMLEKKPIHLDSLLMRICYMDVLKRTCTWVHNST